AHKLGPDRILIAPSCSLLHTPVDLDEEKQLDAELTGWLAFAKQKLEELATLERALSHGKEALRELLDANRRTMRAKQESPRIHDPKVKERVAAVTPQMAARKSSFPERRKVQQVRLKLPLFPTTTIGSFPQTKEIREARAQHKSGKRDRESY